MINLTNEQTNFTVWESSMNSVVDMSAWSADDKAELYLENMESLMLGDLK